MAYITIAEAKGFAGGNINATDEAQLTTYITQAQRWIERYTHRVFEAAADSTKYIDALGAHLVGDTLYLDGRGGTAEYYGDLCAITTVTNGDSAVITSAEYTTVPRNSTPYYGVKILTSSDQFWEYTGDDYEGAISIVGRWAYSITAPDDVKLACMMLVKYIFMRQQMNADDNRAIIIPAVQGVSVPSGFPKDVFTLLEPYRRST